jgi:1-carboxybiuret hydrolase subunit AtzG-like protein
LIDAKQLAELARVAGLEVPQKNAAAVLMNLQRNEAAAALLEAAGLGPEDELGPEWKP